MFCTLNDVKNHQSNRKLENPLFTFNNSLFVGWSNKLFQQEYVFENNISESTNFI